MSSSTSMLHAGMRCVSSLFRLVETLPTVCGSSVLSSVFAYGRFRLLTAHHGHTVRAALRAATLRFPHPPWLPLTVARALRVQLYAVVA